MNVLCKLGFHKKRWFKEVFGWQTFWWFYRCERCQKENRVKAIETQSYDHEDPEFGTECGDPFCLGDGHCHGWTDMEGRHVHGTCVIDDRAGGQRET